MHTKPGYTIEETRQGPFTLLVSQSADGRGAGSAYVDDGVSYPPEPSRTLTFAVTKRQVLVKGQGAYHVAQRLAEIIVLGVDKKPSHVSLNGKKVENWEFLAPQQKLVAKDLDADLNGAVALQWK